MKTQRRLALASLVAAAPFCCTAADAPVGCDRDDVDTHVRDQIQLYGPRSARHEYFAFVYLYQRTLASAVVRGSECRSADRCMLDTAPAAKLIPRGARVVGEWHTHPHQGSNVLSQEDVRGAYNNRHIRCYVAYYAKPNGEILTWDLQQTSVPTAMASRVVIGNYFDEIRRRALNANTVVHSDDHDM